MQHSPYRDEPGPRHSEAELQQYYDAPYGASQGKSSQVDQQQLRGYREDPGSGPGGYNASGARTQPIQQNNDWLEKSATRERGRPKWIMILGAVALLALIGGGVAVGIVLAKKKSSSDSSPSSSLSSSSSSSNSSSDPSVFTKNPALIQSFYGIAYTPEGVQLPDCGAQLDDVITDIQLLSQLTTRIRLYGSDCNQTMLVLEAIQLTKVNMTVWLGNYPVATDNGTAYLRQRDENTAAIEKYGAGNIGGYTVGNEFILDYLDDNNATDPNGSVGDAGAAILLPFIDDTRTLLSNMSLSNISVGNAEAGAYFNTEVLGAVDYGMANVHPWFAATTIDAAASWTWEFFQDTDVSEANALSNAPQMFIAETVLNSFARLAYGMSTRVVSVQLGSAALWNSTDAASASNGASEATEANLQYFLDTFVCQANANGTKYFFFEYFDEPWKGVEFGGVEGYWGLFYANRTLKGITIPAC